MYVEELLLKIPEWLSELDDWHKGFIRSISQQIAADKPLSTRQATVILKLIRQLHDLLIKQGWATEADLASMLHTPQYRHLPYESFSLPKECRYLGNNLLAFRFKAHTPLQEKIKELGTTTTSWFGEPPLTPHLKPRFDWLYKVWIVPVYRFNLQAIIDLIKDEHFNVDGTVSHYLALANRSFNQSSLFSIDETMGVILANVCDHPILAAWITEIAEGIPL